MSTVPAQSYRVCVIHADIMQPPILRSEKWANIVNDLALSSCSWGGSAHLQAHVAATGLQGHNPLAAVLFEDLESMSYLLGDIYITATNAEFGVVDFPEAIFGDILDVRREYIAIETDPEPPADDSTSTAEIQSRPEPDQLDVAEIEAPSPAEKAEV